MMSLPATRHCAARSVRTRLLLVGALVLLPAAGELSGQATYSDRLFRFERAWALAGPCCGDRGDDIAVDADGSYFIVGSYGALDLDGDGAIDQRSGGGRDPIIMKGRPSGQLAWVRAPRSPAASFGGWSVALDRRGGAYLAGPFRDSMVFRSGERIVARGPTDGVLVRYSADGEPLWARVIGGDGTDLLSDAASDAAGHVYVIATIQGAVDLDSDRRPDATATAANGLLVASYDASGALRWARSPASRSDVTAVAVAATSEGAVYLTGHYRGADVDIDRDGRVDLPDPGGDGAPFVAHLDPAGKLMRAFALLGTGANRIGKLAEAANGDLIAAGYTQGSVDLDRDGKPDVVAMGGKQMPYVARFDGDGRLLWVRVLPPDERVAMLALAVGTDRMVVSGLYQGRLDLDGDGRPDAASDPDGNSEGLMVVLDNAGAIRQVLAITGPGDDQARGVALSPDGQSLLVTGFVRLTADFDGDGVPEGGVKCDNFGDIIGGHYRLPPP